MERAKPVVSAWVAFRVAVIVASAAAALAVFLAAMGLGWQDVGFTGFRLDTNTGRIVEVSAGSPAARAGLRAGEVVVASSLEATQRVLLFDVEAVPPDRRLSFEVEAAAGRRTVSLVSARAPAGRSAVDIALICLQGVEYLVFVLTGAALVLLRPSRMTWALYVYCLCTAQIHDGFRYYDALPPALFLAFYLFGATFLTGFAPVPLLPFVTRFPSETPEGWRRALARWASVIVLLAAVHWALLAVAATFLPALRPTLVPYYRFVHVVSAVAAYFGAAFVLFKTYREASGPDRQRLQWAVFGMSFSFAAMALGYVISALSPLAFSVTRAINLFSIVMPIAITYAILKHRLIDVRFVANRAAVYAAMTTIVVILLEFIDWLAGTLLAEDHLAKVAEGFAAVALGFASDRLYKIVETTIEKLLFRARHRAEQHLVRVGAAFAFTQSENSIGEGLILEAADALSLASAAVFRPGPGGRCFTRTIDIGWAECDARELDVDDALVRYLRAEESAIAIPDAHWKRSDVPHGSAAPAIAVPLCVRHALVGIALYGFHRNGSELDPAEVGILSKLGADAARAFDHADAEETMKGLKRRNAELEAAAQHIEKLSAR